MIDKATFGIDISTIDNYVDQIRAATTCTKWITKAMDEATMDFDELESRYTINTTVDTGGYPEVFTGEGDTPYAAFRSLSGQLRDFFFGPLGAESGADSDSFTALSELLKGAAKGGSGTN